MTRILQIAAAVFCISSSAAAEGPDCAPLGMDKDALSALAAEGFEVSDERRPALAIALLDCLAAADPQLRDGVAYGALSTWMRAGLLAEAEVRALKTQLVAILEGPTDPPGVRKPFAALVLSEVARVDRISPYLTGTERTALAKTAATYIQGIDDYRGFEDGVGWRHAVAHGSDIVLQLALNPALTDDQAETLLAALLSQAAPLSHSYVHGESGRIGRAVHYLALSGQIEADRFATALGSLADPSPFPDWPSAMETEAGLAKIHNTRALARSLYVSAEASDRDALDPIADAALSVLSALP